MKTEKQRKNYRRILGFSLSLAFMMINTSHVFATLNETTENVSAGDRANIFSVELPTMDENEPSPFDFYSDPEELIYATDAQMYGGGNVEKNATVLFKNEDGDYDFSSVSDRLTVFNKGEGSVYVTLSAEIEESRDVNLVADARFEGNNSDVYLALVDDKGNEKPIWANEKIQVVQKIEASEGYNFGLTGACNAHGDWIDQDAHIVVRITWEISPCKI